MIRWFRTLVDGWLERHFSEPAVPRSFDDLYELPPAELERKADAGDGKAAYVLGDMHDKGQVGEAANFQEALRWYRRAEKLGDGDALNNLGSMHHHGELLEKDVGRAIDYYLQAGRAGCAVGWGNLGRMYLKGDGVPKQLRKARRLLWRGVRGGDPNAMIGLGHAFHVGAFSPRPLRALYCYRKAASHGETPALFNLGLMYWLGEYVCRDDEKALSLFREAACCGHTAATYYVGIAYRDGRGVDRSPPLALEAFLDASDLGSEAAANDRDDLVVADPTLNAEFGDYRRLHGDFAGAVPLYRLALPHLEAQTGEAARRRFLRANASLASCLHMTRTFGDARRINAAILPDIEALDGEASDEAYLVRGNLADNLFRLGDFAAATRLIERTMALSEAKGDLNRLYHALNCLAVLKFEEGLFQDADHLLRWRIDIAGQLADTALEAAARKQHAAMLQMNLPEDDAERPILKI